MGNAHKHHDLVILNQKIIINSAYKMYLEIASLQTFPHGLDGMKLWDAGIVLARYVIKNNGLFKNKSVLELGCGVGIGGLAVQKWTQCKSIQMSDYNSKVTENVHRNAQKNGLQCKTFIFDWRESDKVFNKYDIIIGSDIVYFGCPVQDLYNVFKRLLNEQGIGIIVIPERKNYAKLFVDLIEDSIFQVYVEKLEDKQYFQNPLQNQKEGFERYPLLHQIQFKVYKITKKST